MKARSILVLGAALALLSVSVQSPPSQSFAAATPRLQAVLQPEWMKHTYPVRIRAYSSDPRSYGAAVYPQGTGVSIGDGRILTAAHLSEHCQPGFVAEVKVGDQWVKGRFVPVAGKDLATVTIDQRLPGVEIRSPKYGEPVTVYGLRSGTLQAGINSNTEQISLAVDEVGVMQGDSGGGIFADDGCLVGTIRGINPAEARVVYFTASIDLTAPQRPASTASMSGSCPGGVCRVR